MRRILKVLLMLIPAIFLMLLVFVAYIDHFVTLSPPDVEDQGITAQELSRRDDGVRQLGSNWLRQDETGIWEMYIEGRPFDRGFAAGKMAEDLLLYQEEVFVNQVEEFVPNSFYRKFLMNAIKYYNRHLNDYVPLEYREEIYGVSLSAPSTHDYIGSKYARKLSFHAAHDIGHAFQNMGFVSGCTALTARDSATQHLLLGRNFDFYIGDDFAKNKIVSFVRPDKGYAFVSLAWAGMMGVVSGMNEHGLAVVLNAGPSEMPKGVKTPVTIIAREILQYARTLAEAEAIARNHDVFVSENFIVGSGKEDRVISIEKSPGSTSIWEQSPAEFVCTNHFQSLENKNSEANLKAKRQTSSGYRYDRVVELKKAHPVKSIDGMIDLLRNTEGLHDEVLGLGNEMAINQLTGLHSVIFNLTTKQVHMAGVPAQIGPYLSYDLDRIFDNKYNQPQRLWYDSIPADQLLFSPKYKSFKQFQLATKKLEKDISNEIPWADSELLTFEQLNPEHYQTYMLLGAYYSIHGDCVRGTLLLKKALAMPIPWAADRDEIEKAIASCE